MTAVTKERLRERASEKVKGLEIAVTQSAFADTRAELEEELELARIALASLEAEPIGAFHIADQQVDGTSDYIEDGEWPIDNGIIEVYAAPPALQEHRNAAAEPDYIRYDCGCCGWETIKDWRENDACPKCNHKPMGKTELYTAPPAPVVVPDERAAFNAWNNDTDCPLAGRDAKTAAWLAWSRRAAMLQSFGNSEQLNEIGSWNNHKNTPTAKPAVDTCELIKQVEGMEVSVDVSTCDADAGHRYFGTVTEVSELDGAKNGYILLVQDAEPNFDVNGNSPVIPDGYVLVPIEPTEAMMLHKSGCQHHAWDDPDCAMRQTRRLVWSHMLEAAAPQQEVN